jgi:lipopolysaccharide export system permease protein
MTKIDRYLLFLYLRVFAICFLTLSGLLIVVQVFTNLDELIAFGKDRGGFVKGLVIYFSPYMLSIFDRMCGLIAMLATMFVVAWLYRTNEMTALLAAGISKGRVVRPILVVSVVLMLLAAASREWLIPSYNEMLTKSPRDLRGDSRKPIRPSEDLEKGVLIAGLNLAPGERAIQQPIFRFSGPASTVTTQLTGDKAFYRDANETHPSGYLVTNPKGTESLAGQKSVRTEQEDFLFLPSDSPWLQPNECFIPSGIEFDVLQGGGARQFSSTSELIWRIRNQPQYYGSDLKVAVHTRFLQPMLDFTQLLIGLPMILSNRNRNLVGMALGCVFSFSIFFGIMLGLQTLGSNGTLFSPMVAAWAPLLLFAPFAWAKTVAAMQS